MPFHLLPTADTQSLYFSSLYHSKAKHPGVASQSSQPLHDDMLADWRNVTCGAQKSSRTGQLQNLDRFATIDKFEEQIKGSALSSKAAWLRFQLLKCHPALQPGTCAEALKRKSILEDFLQMGSTCMAKCNKKTRLAHVHKTPPRQTFGLHVQHVWSTYAACLVCICSKVSAVRPSLKQIACC